MHEELISYIFERMEHHLDELDDNLQNESSFDLQTYHLEQIRTMLHLVKDKATATAATAPARI